VTANTTYYFAGAAGWTGTGNIGYYYYFTNFKAMRIA
jgi:hypothetical protein